MNATALAVQCLQLALAATDDDSLPRLFAGPSGQAALANHSWSYTADDGSIDGWVLSESFQPGSSGGVGHDGSDLFANLVGSQHVLDFVDIEITEAWYPMQVVEKRAAPGPHGAGRYRSGSGCRMSYRVTGDRRLTGAMFAMRETLPVGGVAGGEPGAPTEFRIRHADGASRRSPPTSRTSCSNRATCSSSRRARAAGSAIPSNASRRACAATSSSGGWRATTRSRRTASCSTTTARSTRHGPMPRRAEIRSGGSPTRGRPWSP